MWLSLFVFVPERESFDIDADVMYVDQGTPPSKHKLKNGDGRRKLWAEFRERRVGIKGVGGGFWGLCEWDESVAESDGYVVSLKIKLSL